MNKTTTLPALLPLMFATASAVAAKPPTFATALRFEIRVTRPGIQEPRNGRLFVVLGREARPEPRMTLARTGMDASPTFAKDVDGLSSGTVAVIDSSAAAFPVVDLDHLPPGEYFAQSVFHSNPDLNIANAPGDLYGPVHKVSIDPIKGGTIALELSEEVPAEKLPTETEYVKFVKLKSELLSQFYGRPMYLRAGVIVPRGFDRETEKRYPLRVHIGGYGGRYTGVLGRMREGSPFRETWLSEDTPKMLLLALDGAGPLGDPYQVNSDNHGPYGDAITKELIPYVEQKFRGIGTPKSRVLDGGSTGGWVSFALQVFYPDFFNGCWSFCPDSVDFRSFQVVNIYDDKNAYVNESGFERPGCRTTDGDVKYTMRHELQMENLLGRGNLWTMSGGQWGAWNATYGPKGKDGRPVPIWDPKSGEINHEVAKHWKNYDLRMILENNWKRLGPKLQSKIHIWVGEADDFFLNNAVHRLDDFLSKAEPPYKGTITYRPGEGHCWIGIDEAEMMKQMAKATGN